MAATAWLIDNVCPRAETRVETLAEDLLDGTDVCDDGGPTGGPGVGGDVGWTECGGGCEESTATETIGFVTYIDGWRCSVTYEAEVTVNSDCTTSTVRTSDYASVCMPE
jgi:hypothetical protein